MAREYDLGIVGAGFAGLSCAKSAASAGLRTVVFDKKSRPGAYTQSTGIFVKEIAEVLDIPAKLTRKIAGVRLYAPNMQYFDLTSPGYYFLATDTAAVLDWMAQRAMEQGVSIFSPERVTRVVHSPSQVWLPAQQTSCDYLVGADGANSPVARATNLGMNTHFLRGAEYEGKGFDSLDGDFLHVFLDSVNAPGYIGWLLKGVSSVQLGVAAKGSARSRLPQFVEKLRNHFGEWFEITGGRGGLIPCGGVVKPFARDRVCLLGDAAGMVSPLTAGGIHPAIETGEALGAAIARHLLHGAERPDRFIARSVLPTYRFKRPLRAAFDCITPPNRVYNRVLANPLFRRLAQVLFFHHRGLFSGAAWREIVLGMDGAGAE
ncbi:MAG: NAD(P)/FAD-dependent oxidoreductase [Pseudomonadota bacterium]